MRVLIGGRPATLNPRRLLGEGGEATVLLHGERNHKCAVKLYKAPAQDRVPKLEALLAMSSALEPYAAAPKALVQDAASGAVLGFTMPLCEGFEPVALLAKSSFRASANIDLASMLRLLVLLSRGLGALHLAGAVVGDLNDQNELFAKGAARVMFIDADSFQVAGFSCEVVTEAFLDPLLYGPDLRQPCATKAGLPRWFGRGSDWYALAAIAFRSLTGVHPFGGSTHAPLSLAARAVTAVSVLSPGVTVQSHLRARISALPDALLGAFLDVFEKRDRRPLEEGLLLRAAEGARRCSCGLEIAGGVRACPSCTAHRAAGCGRLAVRELARVNGVVLAASSVGLAWYAIAHEADRLLLLRGTDAGPGPETKVIACPAAPVTAYLAGSVAVLAHVVGDSARLVVIECKAGTVLFETATEVAFGQPAIAIAGGVLYRVARGTLMAMTIASGTEKPLLAVVSEQTCLHATVGGVVAVTAILGSRRYARLDEAGALDLEVDLLAAGERLLDESLYDDGKLLLLMRRTALSGVEHVRTTLLDAAGKRVRTERVAADHRVAEHAISGGLFARGAYLVASDRGLVRQDVTAPSTPVTFPETEPFLITDARLTSSSFGVIAAVGGSLRLLSQKPS